MNGYRIRVITHACTLHKGVVLIRVILDPHLIIVESIPHRAINEARIFQQVSAHPSVYVLLALTSNASLSRLTDEELTVA